MCVDQPNGYYNIEIDLTFPGLRHIISDFLESRRYLELIEHPESVLYTFLKLLYVCW